MILSSNTPNPVRPIGSTVTLTCTVHVDLSAAVDLPAIVNIDVLPQFAPHDGVLVTTSQPIIGDTNVYTTTAMVSSFERNQSGSYECLAGLHSALNNTYICESFGIGYTIEITTGESIALLLVNLNLATTFHLYRSVFSIRKSIHC